MALTGTPVENRLAELWAILDWAVPGLLGPFARFREHYAVPIERWRDPDAAARLRAITAPFVLRRVKTDPAVVADLPPKQSHPVVCGLTREQASLYQAAVDAAFADDLGDGIERRGRILELLTALKQICNHPAQYLHEPGPLVGRSGKLDRLTDMLATWSPTATGRWCSPSTGRWARCWPATSPRRWTCRPCRSCTAGSPGRGARRWSRRSRPTPPRRRCCWCR